MDYSLGASSSNWSKFGHPNSQIWPSHPCNLEHCSSGFDTHCFQAHYISKMDGDNDDSWSSVYPHHDGDHDDDASSWSSVYSYHGSRYPHQVRFMMRNE